MAVIVLKKEHSHHGIMELMFRIGSNGCWDNYYDISAGKGSNSDLTEGTRAGDDIHICRSTVPKKGHLGRNPISRIYIKHQDGCYSGSEQPDNDRDITSGTGGDHHLQLCFQRWQPPTSSSQAMVTSESLSLEAPKDVTAQRRALSDLMAVNQSMDVSLEDQSKAVTTVQAAADTWKCAGVSESGSMYTAFQYKPNGGAALTKSQLLATQGPSVWLRSTAVPKWTGCPTSSDATKPACPKSMTACSTKGLCNDARRNKVWSTYYVSETDYCPLDLTGRLAGTHPIEIDHVRVWDRKMTGACTVLVESI